MDIDSREMLTVSRVRRGSMQTIIVALATSAFLTGCVSGSGSEARPPNYVSSQTTQSPGIRNDSFGGAAMPVRGQPR
jgi:hypothetical protein